MVIKLQIFTIKKIPRLDSNHTCNYIGFCSQNDGSYQLQVFLKECKYIENKVVRYIHENLTDFSYSSDESDEEQIF